MKKHSIQFPLTGARMARMNFSKSGVSANRDKLPSSVHYIFHIYRRDRLLIGPNTSWQKPYIKLIYSGEVERPIEIASSLYCNCRIDLKNKCLPKSHVAWARDSTSMAQPHVKYRRLTLKKSGFQKALTYVNQFFPRKPVNPSSIYRHKERSNSLKTSPHRHKGTF